MPDARLFKGGGHCPDFAIWTGERVGDFVKDSQTGGVDAVVIGDENTHVPALCFCLVSV